MVTMLQKALLFPLIFGLSSFAFIQSQEYQTSSLTPTSSTLKYHGGPLLTRPRGVNVYLIWYGAFSRPNRASITDFFASFNPLKSHLPHQEPSVAAWWRAIRSYQDSSGKPVSTTARLIKQVGDIYSLGKKIKRAQIAALIKNKISNKIFPLDSNGIYLVLTAKDVSVERFCMGSCGFHDSIQVSEKTRVVYGHVGDSLAQCPGLCAWPYAIPENGPPGKARLAPNGVESDGMVINIGAVLVGAVTNPYKTGYFQGDALAPLEAVTACSGIFGVGAYPGYPGDLLVDKSSNASYNLYGVNGRKFLLPAVWDLHSFNCKVIA
ncbi:protein EXORDIUM-like 2 [Neltuma alba]|uniref:protein EXORDIUM-like 2 n=1 Tax=Neltuma alba TaxID=207710 RepID=UPI0010A46573|nr:protein EXORDIUM-like 2 [Prosopis alba]